MSSLKNGDGIYISGLEPYFNPFSYGPGDSIRIFSEKTDLKIYVDLSDQELDTLFCSDPRSKKFIRFDGNLPRAITEEKQLSCKTIS
jgi:hypothetical protein